MKREPNNKRVETNRRPTSPFMAGQELEPASCAPPFLSAAVAHPGRFVHMVKRILTILACCLLADIVLAAERSRNRPASWAQPFKLDGVPNLHQINTNLYRSAQPTAQGMRNLSKKGVKTVVNLRSFHSDRDEIGSSGLGYEHIYMKAWHPERKEIVRFLQIATDPKRTPVLVHCQHGADRTGTMCAVYRIAVQDWTAARSIVFSRA